MTRAKTKKTPEERAHDRARGRILSNYWGERILAAKDVKKEYADTAAEVMLYFKAKHDHLYEQTTDFMDYTGMATASVPMIAKMKSSLGPRLYVAAPVRTVIPRSPDGVMIAFARLASAYLTQTAREVHFARTMRRSIDDGLLRGRPMLRLCWDDVRKIIASEHLSSTDFVFDPDFIEPQDAQWIAIRHREPLWAMKRRIPKWRLKGLAEQSESGTVIGQSTHETGDQSEEDDETVNPVRRPTATVVEWWEVVSKMGSGARGADLPQDIKRLDQDEEDFVRICVVLGHDKLLEEGDWDVPLYLDREWPVSFTDFVETPGASWPQSCMGQVLPLQKQVDILTSIQLSSCKNRSRVVLLMEKRMAAEVQDRLRSGSSADAIPVALPAGYTLDMVAKVLDFGQGSTECMTEREFCMREIEVTVGTTEMVTGGQTDGAQDRSATATNLRNSASEVRSADLENKVAELMTDAARKEAIALRLFVSAEDVASIVQAADINMFYVQVMLPGDAEIPLRPTKFGEGDPEGALTMADIEPACATYFDQTTAAAEAVMKVWEAILTAQEPRVMQIRDTLMMAGIDPETNMPSGITVQLVTPEKVWQDTAGRTAEEWMRELSYEIEASRGVKFDKAAERASIDNMMQMLPPVMMQIGDIEGLNNLLDRWGEAYQIPPEKRLRITPPAVPPPGQDQGGEGEDKGEDGPPKKEKK